jgi:flagellar biosynthesis protein FlhF
MGRAACREILTQYGFLKKYKLLFTKLDEALVPGIILNARYSTGKPLSYTTAGQSVPDDIEIANIHEIVKSILQPKDG